MKIGFIMLWYGLVANVPPGWQLCDGTNGTPDLRNRFVPCAGTSYNPGDSGGANTHSHSFTADGHYHGLKPGAGIAIGTDYARATLPGIETGNVNVGSNLPKYHSLCYIMKL